MPNGAAFRGLKGEMGLNRKEVIEEKAWTLLELVTKELGFIPVDAEFVREGKDYYLNCYIDREGGIGVDECEAASRMIDPMLDEANFIDVPYTLIMSSPGLGRPLKRPRDFIFAQGKEIEIRTYRAYDGKKEFTGILESWDKDSVTIRVGDGTQTIRRAEISLIRLAFDF